MITEAIERLNFLLNTIPPVLLAISEPDLSHKPAPGKWSKKEIIGHLIDSAANNHHRLVRTQFENDVRIVYDQVNWNRYSYYQQMDGDRVIHFWEAYNRHLLDLIKCIHPENLLRECDMGYENKVPLSFVINDYVRHLEHHLHQVINY